MAESIDPFDLERFVMAQADVYDAALREIRDGRKRTHWMWFVFPQVAGLGHSPNAKYYAIQSKDEAEAYFSHPVLGGRLRQCTQTVLELSKSAHQIFGSPDDMKFRSSLTLFEWAIRDPIFTAALTRFYGGQPDCATLGIVDRWTA
jgi:uncharacterized protein (DUF1810 family)